MDSSHPNPAEAIRRISDFLERDLDDGWSATRALPRLAHYTSLIALENIARSKQIWMSSPLVMNDYEEVVWGLESAVECLIADHSLSNDIGVNRLQLFTEAFNQQHQKFLRSQLADVYVFCLSEHGDADRDGLLSMWRGYGHDGKGAALILGLGHLAPLAESPLILARVEYLSRQDRVQWILKRFRDIVSHPDTAHLIDTHVEALSEVVFSRILVAAMYSKHLGFSEEKEWRIVYLPSRDLDGKLRPFRHYVNSERGIEPKLRLPLDRAPPGVLGDINLEKIVETILLGPSRTSPLVEMSVKRMLCSHGALALAERVRSSGIPYRPRP